MNLSIFSMLLAGISMIGSAAYVAARWKSSGTAAAIAKAAASTAFISLAVANGATQTRYGMLVLAALAFSWLGDMLLLSLRSSFLLAGIAAFFFAHVAFVWAFALSKLDAAAGAVSLAMVVLLGAIVLRWLWKCLHGFYRIAVPLYLAAIAAMVVLAIAGVTAGSLPPTVATGAVAFAMSDISVARDRFVEKSIANKAWGLPLYYFAQILLAASVSVPVI